MKVLKSTLKIADEQPRTVKIKVPDLALTILAMKAADHVFASAGPAAGLEEAARCLLRLALVELDGQAVTYAETEGDALAKRLTPRQIDALTKALDRLTAPTVGEGKQVLDSLAVEAREGKVVHTITIPGRTDATAAPAARVAFVTPSRNVERTATTRAERLERRSQMIRLLHTTRERAALCVELVEVLDDSGDVVASHSGEAGFNALAYWQQAALVAALEEVTTADKAEVDDFLSSAAPA